MALYVTKSVNFGSKLDAFKDRGLDNEACCSIADASIFAVGNPPNAFIIAIQNLRCEILARVEKKPIYYNNSMSNVLSRFDGPKFEPPVLMVEYKQGGEELNSLGMFEAGTSKMGVYAGTPTTEQVRLIAQLGISPFNTVQAGNVNLGGEYAYIWAWRGINAYLALGGGKSMIETGVQVGRATIQKLVEKNADIIEKVVNGIDGVTSETAEFKGAVYPVDSFNLMAAGVGLANVELQCIKDHQFTPPTPGHVFLFFKEMLDTDPNTPFQIFLSLFNKCIADNAEEYSQLVIMLRRGFRYLASTTAGKIIQHIYFGIKLSMETGGTLNLLRDGSQYAGFTLETESSLIVKNRLVAPLAVEEFAKVISTLNTHREAVKNIVDTVESMLHASEVEMDLSRERAATSPRYLRDIILRARADVVEENRYALSGFIEKLNYDQTYWDPTPERILEFLTAMSSSKDMHDQPMYVSVDTMLNRTSEILPYIAVFGPTAPSVFHGDTPRKIMPIGQEDPNLEVVNNKRVVPHIPVYLKGVGSAAGDWASVRTQKSFKYIGPKKNEAGKFSSTRNRSLVISGTTFDEFYTALRIWSRSNRERVVPAGRAKRTADDMDEDREEGSSKKQKRVQKIATFI